jgi:hypothetical protein
LHIAPVAVVAVAASVILMIVTHALCSLPFPNFLSGLWSHRFQRNTSPGNI